ncbi:MAG: hypothetical protein RLZZ591_239 [Pseudomonadota bacterium]|jgi:type I restriction enzyme M protein
MTSQQQRAELQSKIWKIANDVRGAVDGWDFKQYVLGTLFYRFISENFAAYIEGGDDSIDYAVLNDVVITPEIRDDAIKTKGYFICPSQLFAQVVATAILDKFDALTDSITEGLPREIELRQKQYAHYQDLLLSFSKPQEVVA